MALQLPCLKNLVIVGNPLCLMPSFRLSVISPLPLLRWLDDVTIPQAEHAAAMALTEKKEQLRKQVHDDADQ